MNNRNTDGLALDEVSSRFPQVARHATAAARLMLGAGKEHLVKEVVNDTLMLLWQQHLAGKPPAKPENWAHTVARRRAARLARVEGRYVRGLLEDEGEAQEGYLPMPATEL